MPTWPDGVTLVTIRHTPVTTGGRILAGNLVSAVVSERVWGEEGSILPAEHSTTIQADGSWEIELPAVDSPGLRPQGVAYRLTEHVPGGRELWVAPLVSHAPGPVDLADVLSPAPSPGGGVVYPVTPEMQALADAAQQSAEDAEAARDQTVALGLTVDTSVGTRVMVGDVMVYGDTGWRDVEWMPAGHEWSIQWARRAGNQVRLRVEGTISESGSTSAAAVVAAGFRIAGSYGAHFPVSIGSGDGYAFQTNASGTTYLTGRALTPGSLRAEFAWTTNQAWPSTLPGTPA